MQQVVGVGDLASWKSRDFENTGPQRFQTCALPKALQSFAIFCDYSAKTLHRVLRFALCDLKMQRFCDCCILWDARVGNSASERETMLRASR